MHGHVRLALQQAVQPFEQRAAACQDDSALHNVRGELGRAGLERHLDRFDDGAHRVVNGFAYFGRGDRSGSGKSRDEVPPANLQGPVVAVRKGRPNFDFGHLGSTVADEKVVSPPYVARDRFVHLITGNSYGAAGYDPTQRDHGDFGSPASDVDDHGACRLGDRKSGADGGGHGLLDQVRFFSARLLGGFSNGAFFDLGNAGWNADDYHG